MALMTEAFAVGAAPPTLPTARFAAQPRHQEAHEIREQGSSSALVAAATVLAAGVAAKRRTVPVRAAVVMRDGAARQAPFFKKAWALSLMAAICVAAVAPRIELGQLQLGVAPAAARSTTAYGTRVNKDPTSLLQYALPLEETAGEDKVKPIREVQASLEESRLYVTQRIFDKAKGGITDVLKKISQKSKDILKPVRDADKPAAEALLSELGTTCDEILKEIDGAEYGGTATPYQADMVEKAGQSSNKAQELVGKIEELMLPADYAAKVPAEYANLPRLDGRAVLEWTLTRGPESGATKYVIDEELIEEAKFTMVIDGWSAPLSAGNFLDLVNRKFYNGLPIQRADGFIIQTGDPGADKGNGFSPGPGQPVRTIPLEVGIRGRKEALYGETIDEARLVGTEVKIPFQADGTIALARREFDNDSASSQVFMFLFESDMTPAGKNLFDGRYGSFGYVTDGDKFLRKIRAGDIVKDIKIVSGLDKLKQPAQ